MKLLKYYLTTPIRIGFDFDNENGYNSYNKHIKLIDVSIGRCLFYSERQYFIGLTFFNFTIMLELFFKG